jgi:hypothetical protein
MKLSLISLKIRAANTTFGNNIGGSADLIRARDGTFDPLVPCAWVVPANETAEPNNQDAGYVQKLRETFSVVVAINNSGDYSGMAAYDTLHDLRAEIFGAILNWYIDDYEDPVEFVGGSLWAITRSLLFYKYDFAIGSYIQGEDGVEPGPYDELMKIYGLNELVTNGYFVSDLNWNKGDGWTITGGQAVCDGSQVAESELNQDLGSELVPTTKTYRARCSITRTAGTLTLKVGGTTLKAFTADEEYDEDVTVGSTDTYIRFVASADFVGTVDNVRFEAQRGIDLGGDEEFDAEMTVDLPGSQ